MQQHQKYFPLLDASTGKLLPRFLIVTNLETDDPRNIVAGNERVLRARLADAKFFFDQDRKMRARRARASGSAAWSITTSSAPSSSAWSASSKLAERDRREAAAPMPTRPSAPPGCARPTSSTDMVGEFPELQGIMGDYYALHDGEDDSGGRAIEAHYRPRFAGDTLPEDNVGCAVALADKLDTLVGIFGIGLVPTGDKDPFGLRRQALGVLRILSERALPLDLIELLQLRQAQLRDRACVRDSVAADLHAFMLERLRSYLRERGFALDEVDSVLGQNPTRIDLVVPRLEAVQAFRALPEAEASPAPTSASATS